MLLVCTQDLSLKAFEHFWLRSCELCGVLAYLLWKLKPAIQEGLWYAVVSVETGWLCWGLEFGSRFRKKTPKFMYIPFFPWLYLCLSVYFVFDGYSSKLDIMSLSLETKSILCQLSKLNKCKMKLLLEFGFVSLWWNTHLYPLTFI